MPSYKNDGRGELYGAWTANNFRFAHKSLNPKFYATDIDFVLIGDNDIVAVLELKCKNTEVALSEKTSGNLYQYTQSVAFTKFMQSGINCFVVLFRTNNDGDVWDIDIKQVVNIDATNKEWGTKDILIGVSLEGFSSWENSIRASFLGTKTQISRDTISYTFLDILVKCPIPDTNDATYAEVLRLLRQSQGSHDRYTIHFDPSPSQNVFASRGTMQYSTQLLHDVAKVVGYGNIAHWQRVVINKTLT